MKATKKALDAWRGFRGKEKPKKQRFYRGFVKRGQPIRCPQLLSRVGSMTEISTWWGWGGLGHVPTPSALFSLVQVRERERIRVVEYN